MRSAADSFESAVVNVVLRVPMRRAWRRTRASSGTAGTVSEAGKRQHERKHTTEVRHKPTLRPQRRLVPVSVGQCLWDSVCATVSVRLCLCDSVCGTVSVRL